MLEEEVSGIWQGDRVVALGQWEIVEKSRWQMHSQIALLVKIFSIDPEAVIRICNNPGS